MQLYAATVLLATICRAIPTRAGIDIPGLIIDAC